MQEKHPTIESLNETIVDLLPDMFVLFDSNGTIADIRRPIPGLLSDNAESYIGRNIRELNLRPVIGDESERLDEALRTRQSRRLGFGLRGKDDLMHYYEVVLFPLATGQVLADIRAVHEEFATRMESEHLRRFFDRVLGNIAIPISVKNMDTGRYVFWSRKAEVFGHTSDEMVGNTEALFMPPEKASAVREIVCRLAEGKLDKYEGVETHRLQDGREHTFIVTRTPFRFGRERLILSSALDISELKAARTSLLHARDELARKNMTLSSVLSLARVIPWECDLKTQTFYCDYEAYHPTHASGPDSAGRYVIPMDRYFASVHPDYREEAIRMIDELVAGTREEFNQTYLVHWFNNREWEWVQVQSGVAERDADGQPVHLIGSAQRISEQKRMEIALREAKEDLAVKNATLSSALTIARVIPWVGDPDSETLWCDYDAYHHQSATGPDAQGHYMVKIKEYFDRIHPDHRAQVYDQYIDLIEGRLAEFHEIYPIHWSNDREYEWVEVLGSMSRQAQDGTRRVVGSVRVITAQKRMEESLRQAKEEAERSNMLKSAFLANVSHEIRTPLNAIIGFSELLAQSENADEKNEYLGIIRSSNSLLLQLIGDILDLSKIEAGTLEFTFADHDLDALLEELEQTSRMKVANTDVEVVCTGRTPGCTIHTDRGRLLQVLHNFINNAAKFTRTGHIHFGCRRHIDGRWYFYVEDTGCGIPAEQAATVFERFVKLDRKAQGTGLGLAISKSIIERLGGEIGVTSAVGHGSTFWFLLPTASVTSDTAFVVQATAQAVSSVGTGSAKEKTRILIAEDDPATYRLFEAMLRNYTLLHAWNGRQAVELCREHRPDIILMDIRMPEMDGYEATAAIRAFSPAVPIIGVTAFAYPEDLRRILASGFNGCLPKPVSADKLKEAISGLCSGKSM